MERTVFQDIEVTAETEVLLVVGHKLQVIARVTVHGNRVGNIITVEGNSIVADGRCKRKLQESHMVVIDIHVSENVLDGDIQNITGFKELVYALTCLPHHDMPLILRILPIDMAGYRLIDIQRQNILLSIG